MGKENEDIRGGESATQMNIPGARVRIFRKNGLQVQMIGMALPEISQTHCKPSK